MKTETKSNLVCGHQIQIDRSGGQGHCWRDISADIPSLPTEEIESAILDDKMEHCDDFVASNGQHYRW